MVVFMYLNLLGSWFLDGSYGVFYCICLCDMVIVEMCYYSGLFFVVMKELLMC